MNLAIILVLIIGVLIWGVRAETFAGKLEERHQELQARMESRQQKQAETLH